MDEMIKKIIDELLKEVAEREEKKKDTISFGDYIMEDSFINGILFTISVIHKNSGLDSMEITKKEGK